MFDLVMLVLRYACIALAVWGLVDAALRRKDVFPAIDRQTKPFWLVILGVAVAVLFFFGFFSFFGIAALVASIVYAVDVRPKARAVTRGPQW